MIEYLLAVRRWVASIERVANTGHAIGLPADPHDPVAWVAACSLEDDTAAVFDAGQVAWA